jgi:hypothetical protein
LFKANIVFTKTVYPEKNPVLEIRCFLLFMANGGKAEIRRDTTYELEVVDLFYVTDFEEVSIKRNKFSSKPRTE